jgi:hypothetical protein
MIEERFDQQCDLRMRILELIEDVRAARAERARVLRRNFGRVERGLNVAAQMFERVACGRVERGRAFEFGVQLFEQFAESGFGWIHRAPRFQTIVVPINNNAAERITAKLEYGSIGKKYAASA